MAPAYRVLAVDGGGIRGIIPALILAEIEEMTRRPISDLFDLIAGTSTGGILALGLTKPGADGKPEKTAMDVVRLYEMEGSTIFPTSFLQGLHLGAIRGSKYDSKGIESTLKKYFGDARLKDALTPILVPSYDIEKQTPMFFKSAKAKHDPEYDFPMRQVARATSAAPTYFTPTRIDTPDPLDYYALIDGGVVAGNPAMCAYAEAVKMGQMGERGMMMVSLGTGELRHSYKYKDACDWGQLEWAQPVIDIVFQGSNTAIDYQLQQLLEPTGPKQNYFRLQLELAQSGGNMDDARDANLKYLLNITQDYLSHPDTRESLAQLCEQITAA
jgi:patatin-like phospholipase/acyl hydrolase